MLLTHSAACLLFFLAFLMALSPYFLENDLSCPVCHDIYRDPVLLSCSHSFCKKCLQSWWAEKRVNECVVCKRRSSRGEPPSNLVLKNLCEAFLRERDLHASQALCSLHFEKLKLFCLNHQQPVCVVCRDSEKHNDHKFRPINEAANDHRTKLLEVLKPLQDRLTLLREAKGNCDITAKYIKDQADQTETHIKQQFKKLHRFLDKEEAARIRALREEEKQKSQVMKEKMEVLSREIGVLSEAVRATVEDLTAPDVSFLQSYKAAVERVQHQQPLCKDPGLAPGSLIDVAKHLGNLGFHIWDKMKAITPYTPVILDPNTANAELVLSEDLCTVRWGQRRQLPENPERIQHSSSVLGHQGFNSGTHCWEVEVRDSEYWELGVLSESVSRKDNVTSGLWRIRFYNGKYRASSLSHQDRDLQVKKTFQRINVHLDWGRGTLSFTGSDSHIHTFTHTFTDRLFPYFNCVNALPLKVMPLKHFAAVSSATH